MHRSDCEDIKWQKQKPKLIICLRKCLRSCCSQTVNILKIIHKGLCKTDQLFSSYSHLVSDTVNKELHGCTQCWRIVNCTSDLYQGFVPFCVFSSNVKNYKWCGTKRIKTVYCNWTLLVAVTASPNKASIRRSPPHLCKATSEGWSQQAYNNRDPF